MLKMIPQWFLPLLLSTMALSTHLSVILVVLSNPQRRYARLWLLAVPQPNGQLQNFPKVSLHPNECLLVPVAERMTTTTTMKMHLHLKTFKWMMRKIMPGMLRKKRLTNR
jgi:hypothetical protein